LSSRHSLKLRILHFSVGKISGRYLLTVQRVEPVSVVDALRYRYTLLTSAHQMFVTYLYGKTVREIENTRLADIFCLCARLTYLRGLISRLRSWFPSKRSKRNLANLTGLSVFNFNHSNVGIVSETVLAQNRKIGFCRWCNSTHFCCHSPSPAPQEGALPGCSSWRSSHTLP